MAVSHNRHLITKCQIFLWVSYFTLMFTRHELLYLCNLTDRRHQ